MIENNIGFKFMPFPDYDMFPEDQTTSVPDNDCNDFVGDNEASSKFLYVPFTGLLVVHCQDQSRNHSQLVSESTRSSRKRTQSIYYIVLYTKYFFYFKD
jgi:hypothetical protein